ncbi:hypothetical protein E2C01_071818 [Portunus trituberculatus]|uniref:Uncharacterized protein n=1 Tax=Portunus trituberculatus TaxID=210409 RepID=A0A5B7I626_PORTR|nr:hypothetical protein [Portunus trituberculatus]
MKSQQSLGCLRSRGKTMNYNFPQCSSGNPRLQDPRLPLEATRRSGRRRTGRQQSTITMPF